MSIELKKELTKERLKEPDFVPEVHAEHDRIVALTIEKMKPCISCKEGCHACCSEALAVFSAEVPVIIAAIPPEEMPGVKARLLSWIGWAQKSGVLTKRNPPATDYLRLRLVCPLLKDGRCLIYHNRPLSCRSYYVVGDPKACADLALRPEQKFVEFESADFPCGTLLTVASEYTDHLGVILARKLLGLEIKSAQYQKVKYEFVKVEGETLVFQEKKP